MNRMRSFLPFIRVFEFTDQHVKELELSYFLHQGYIRSMKTYQLSESFKIPQDRKRKPVPLVIILPLDLATHLITDFPDIDDEEEMQEWCNEYFANHTGKTLVHYFPIEKDHKLLLLGISRDKIRSICEEINENIVYIGFGIESLGFVSEYFNQKNLLLTFSKQDYVFSFKNNGIEYFDTIPPNQDRSKIIGSISNYCLPVSGEKVLSNEKEKIPERYLNLLGVGLNIIQNFISEANFILPDLKSENENRIARLKTKRLSLWLAVILFVGYLIPNSFLFFQKRKLTELEDKQIKFENLLTKIEMNKKKIEKLENDLELTQAKLNNSSSYSGIMEILGKNLPENVAFTSLLMDQKKINLEGQATNHTQIAQFIENLEKTNLFISIDLKYITPNLKTSNNNYKQNFSVELQ